jgi:hypothetical protein
MFGSDDTYGLQAAFDAKWDAGVPYTMVIAPGGRVIYQEQGVGGRPGHAPRHSGEPGKRNLRRSPGILGDEIDQHES